MMIRQRIQNCTSKLFVKIAYNITRRPIRLPGSQEASWNTDSCNAIHSDNVVSKYLACKIIIPS